MNLQFGGLDTNSRFSDEPIEIAPDLWWVGGRIEDEQFQCHAYLLVRGDQSVLFDPGSALTWPETRGKIESLISFDDIRWFVVHHQDPDICGAMPEIDRLITRPDAVWVTHWRVAVLLRHYDPQHPFWLIDEHDWRLDVDGRVLEFLFTPYLHFPGAFVTFDKLSGTLLSSDLFGGFTENDNVVCDGLADFEGIRTFHQHYMPDHNILLNAMLKIEQLPLTTIAPQHGKLIIGDDINAYMTRLKSLDCGLYLLTRKNSDIARLQALNNLMRETIETMASERDFRVIVGHIFGQVAEVISVRSTDIFCRLGESRALWMSSSDRFRGSEIAVPDGLRDTVATADTWTPELTRAVCEGGLPITIDEADIRMPLFGSDGERFIGIAVLSVGDDFESSPEIDDILRQISHPVSVAIEREVINRLLDSERNEMYERSIRDPLTNLFTRRYLDDSARRLIEVHQRNHDAGFSLLMIDIDHFKEVNDTYGHAAGDEVLKAVADVLHTHCRRADFAVRFGGEEFTVLMPLTNPESAAVLAERLRMEVESLRPRTSVGQIDVTISLGVAEHKPSESLVDTVKKADRALYEAKESGRNRVCVSSD